MATYNIRSGLAGGLASALRAMGDMGVDIGVLQETKLNGGIYARHGAGYSVFATDSKNRNKGGVALFWKEKHESFVVEEQREWGPHVLSFRLITGKGQYCVIGAYIPPSDDAPLADIEKAWRSCPKGSKPILLGDLNADIEYPKSDRDVAVAEQAAGMDVYDMSRVFRQRHRTRSRGRWTWRQRRRTKWVSSHPDYFLAREGTRKRLTNCAILMPNHNSDHRATVATILSGESKTLRRYRRKRTRFPLRMARFGPRTELEGAFETLVEAVQPQTVRERPRASWISAATWKLVDKRTALRREDNLPQAAARVLGRAIKASLKEDRKKRAEKAATEVEGYLAAGELQEAWRTLKGWYRLAEDRAPKPCYQTLAKQTKERVELYAKREPPGDDIPVNVDPFEVEDDTPTDLEIRACVRLLSSGRASGASGMRAEDIKQWLMDMVEEEKSGKEGAGDMWKHFVLLIQTIWERGEIPPQMAWIIIVLLPKGGGDFRGIGLLEPAWKVVEILMDTRLKSIELYDCLHGFMANRGTGTAIIEVKLTQQLAFLEQCPLFGIFIDLRKA